MPENIIENVENIDNKVTHGLGDYIVRALVASAVAVSAAFILKGVKSLKAKRAAKKAMADEAKAAATEHESNVHDDIDKDIDKIRK